MNPKFDCAVCPEKAATYEVFVQRGVVPQDVSVAQLVAIADRLLVLEVISTHML